MYELLYEFAVYMLITLLVAIVLFIIIHDIYYEIKERRELKARREEAALERYVRYRIDRYLYEHRKDLNK